MQSKKGSFIEACVNTFIGFLVTLIASPAIYWICNVHMTGKSMVSVVILFTLLSVIRSYIIRRFFNKIIIKTINSGGKNTI